MIKVSETAKKKVVELMTDDGFNATQTTFALVLKVVVVLVYLMI